MDLRFIILPNSNYLKDNIIFSNLERIKKNKSLNEDFILILIRIYNSIQYLEKKEVSLINDETFKYIEEVSGVNGNTEEDIFNYIILDNTSPTFENLSLNTDLLTLEDLLYLEESDELISPKAVSETQKFLETQTTIHGRIMEDLLNPNISYDYNEKYYDEFLQILASRIIVKNKQTPPYISDLKDVNELFNFEGIDYNISKNEILKEKIKDIGFNYDEISSTLTDRPNRIITLIINMLHIKENSIVVNPNYIIELIYKLKLSNFLFSKVEYYSKINPVLHITTLSDYKNMLNLYNVEKESLFGKLICFFHIFNEKDLEDDVLNKYMGIKNIANLNILWKIVNWVGIEPKNKLEKYEYTNINNGFDNIDYIKSYNYKMILTAQVGGQQTLSVSNVLDILNDSKELRYLFNYVPITSLNKNFTKYFLIVFNETQFNNSQYKNINKILISNNINVRLDEEIIFFKTSNVIVKKKNTYKIDFSEESNWKSLIKLRKLVTQIYHTLQIS